MEIRLPDDELEWIRGEVARWLQRRSATKRQILSYIVTHTHLNFGFKRAFHFSTLAIKLFNSGTK